MLNRREFLGASLGAAAVAAQAAPTDKFRWAMNGGFFRPMSGMYEAPGLLPHPEEGLKWIARYGFQGVEEFLQDMPKYIDKPPAEFKALLDASGLAMCTIGGRVNPNEGQQTIDEAVELARFIAACGGRHLKVNLGGRPAGAPPNWRTEEEYRVLAKVLNEVGRRTADIGIKFAHHPHARGPVEGNEVLAKVMDMTDPKFVYIIADTCHLSLGGVDPLKCLRDYYPRVAAIHFKDADAKYNVAKTGWKGPAPSAEDHRKFNNFKPFGTGGVDFVGIMGLLRERNYDSWITLDFDAPRPGEGSLKENMDNYTKYISGTLNAALKTS